VASVLLFLACKRRLLIFSACHLFLITALAQGAKATCCGAGATSLWVTITNHGHFQLLHVVLRLAQGVGARRAILAARGLRLEEMVNEWLYIT
jgi:hypothetical protein